MNTINQFIQNHQLHLSHLLGPAGVDALNMTIDWIRDSLFNSSNRLIKNELTKFSKVRVICQKSDGLGDIVFACRVSQVVRKRFPNLEVELQGIDRESHQGLSQYLKNNPMDNVFLTPTPFSSEQLAQEKSEQTFLIHCPYLFSPLRTTNNFPRHQRLDIGEYSNETCVDTENKPAKKSGLGNDELGIFCPQDEETTENPLSFQNFILNMCHPPDLLPTEFYIGYGCDPTVLANYVTLINLSQKKSLENYDICLPGYRLLENPMAFVNFIEKMFHPFTTESEPFSLQIQIILPKDKFQKITSTVNLDPFFNYFSMIRSEQNGIVILSCNLTPSATKTLRVIFPGTISEQDMKNLKKKCKENIPLITGDQSFSNNLGSLFMYEVRSHKHLFFRNLIDLCKNNQLNELADFFTHSRQYTSYAYDSDKTEEIRAFIETWNNPLLKEQSLKLREIIKKDHNLAKRITDIILERDSQL